MCLVADGKSAYVRNELCLPQFVYAKVKLIGRSSSLGAAVSYTVADTRHASDGGTENAGVENTIRAKLQG